MKKIGICLLAYDDEHIEECLFLIKNLNFYKDQVDFYIGTNQMSKFKPSSYIKLIELDEPFNYNLKRKAVEVALKDCDVIVIMDTDIIEHLLYHGDTTTNKTIFNSLNELEDGMYSDYINFFDLNLEHHYQKKIYELSGFYDGLLHVLEHIIILKITDEKVKERFIENWNYFFEESLEHQPLSLVSKQKGAMEGLLIHGCIHKAGLKFTRVFDNPITDYFFCRFYHYDADEKKVDIVKAKGRSII